ncbi:MAG: hypothetical protein AAF078_04310 [Planctomycetota bacterium]
MQQTSEPQTSRGLGHGFWIGVSAFTLVVCGLVAYAAVSFAIGLVVPPTPSVALEPAPADSLADPRLAGEWSILSETIDGRPGFTAEIADGTMVLTMPFENLAQTLRSTLLMVDSGADEEGAWFTLEVVAAEPRQSPWHAMIGGRITFSYRVDGDRLSMASFGPGIEERRTGFEPDGRGFVVNLRRATSREARTQSRTADAAYANAPAKVPEIEGVWVDTEPRSLIFHPDLIQATFGPNRQLVAEVRVIDWDPQPSVSRIEGVVIQHPLTTEMGKRGRTLYEITPDGRLRTATYVGMSPGYGRWPTGFSAAPGLGLVVTEWIKETE